MSKGNGYDWQLDAIRSYAEAIKVMREAYERERLPGETAKEWMKRTHHHAPRPEYPGPRQPGRPRPCAR